jgi:hypothetical protein
MVGYCVPPAGFASLLSVDCSESVTPDTTDLMGSEAVLCVPVVSGVSWPPEGLPSDGLDTFSLGPEFLTAGWMSTTGASVLVALVVADC